MIKDKNIVEYDYYGRPVPDKKLFGHCRFKGGGGTTETHVQIADMTPEEKRLWDVLYPLMTGGTQRAERLGQMFDQYLNDNKLFLPNYGDLYNQSQQERESAHNTWQDYMLAAMNQYDQERQAIEAALSQREQENIDRNYNTLNNYASLADSRNQGFIDDYGTAMSRLTDALNESTTRNEEVFRKNTGDIATALDNRVNALTDTYQQNLSPILDRYNSQMESLAPKLETLSDNIATRAAQTSSGILPEAINQQRIKALQDDSQKLFGNTLAKQAANGTLSSSVANRAYYDAMNSMTDSLAERYANDLTTYSNLLGSGSAQAVNALSSLGNLYNQQLGANKSVYDKIFDTGVSTANNIANGKLSVENSIYSNNNDLAKYRDTQDRATQNTLLAANTQNTNNTLQNFAAVENARNQHQTALHDALVKNANDRVQQAYDNKNNFGNTWLGNKNALATSRLQDALQASQGSWGNLFNMLSAYDQLMAPALNTANTQYAARHGVQSTKTTTTQNSGGSEWLGALGTVGTALIACFPAGALVYTPTGNKRIETLKLGDEVYSYDHDKGLVKETITKTRNSSSEKVFRVFFDDKEFTLDTTEHQPLISSDGLPYTLNQCLHKRVPVLTTGGKLLLITRIEELEEAPVFDITVSGNNQIFVDDILVEGY